MLPKNKRLKKDSDINRLFESGQTTKTDLLICKYAVNQEKSDRPTFSLAKSIKVTKPQKNRLVRQLNHAFKEVESSVKSEQNYDLFFILKKIPEENQPRYEQLKIQIKKILTEIKCPNES